jgi:SAM-dependent methyltransferase
MIGRARERCPNSDFTVVTAETISFLDNSFDAVSSLLAFSYLKNPGKVLSEAFRLVRPGGYIAICTLGKNFFTAGLPAIYRIGEVMKIKQVGVGAFGESYYRGEEMLSLFRQAGFTDITLQRCSFAHINLIDPLFHLARKVEPFVERRIPYLAYNICVSGRKSDYIFALQSTETRHAAERSRGA